MSGLWLLGQKTSRRDLHRELDVRRTVNNQLYRSLAAILIEQGGEVRVPLSTLGLVDQAIPIQARSDEAAGELVITYRVGHEETHTGLVASVDGSDGVSGEAGSTGPAPQECEG